MHKGVCVCVCVWGGGGRFADFISFSFNILWKWNNLVSLRPNYFIFIGYLKTGGGGGGVERNSWTPSGSTTGAYLFESNLVRNPEDRFSLVEAHFVSQSPATAGADTIGRTYEHYRLESAELVHFRVTHLKAARL